MLLNILKKYWVTICLSFVIVASFLLMFLSAKEDSMVIDEKVHISAGYLHVWEGNYLFNSEHPPLLNDLAGLFAKIAKPNLPETSITEFEEGSDQWEYGDLFFYKSGNDVDKIIIWARVPFILLTIGLILVIFFWAKSLFGKKAGLFAATLTAFSPSVLAHGRLATTDIGLVLFFVLTCFCLYKYYLKPSLATALLLGLSLGLALASKFSALAILPVVLFGIFFVFIKERVKITKALWQLLIISIISLVVVWVIYLFSMRQDFLADLQGPYKTTKMLGSQIIFADWLKWLVIPFDKFFQGLKILSEHNASGHWSYLNGVVDYKGWWSYFPLVLLYKMTLAEIALMAIALMMFIFIKSIRKSFVSEFFIIFPPLLFLAVSMIGKIDIGIRHILVLLPFFYIFISRLVNLHNVYLKPIIWILVLAQVFIGIFAYSNYIAYFNLIAGGSKGGVNHLSDSNLDWNQNVKRFVKYAKENNVKKIYELCWDGVSFEYYGIEQQVLPNTPVEGVAVICAQQFTVTPDGFNIDWVTNPPIGRPPDDVIANGIYVWRFDKNNIK